LDTAGFGVPTHHADINSVRATEMFLRNIVLQLSDVIIYVTEKYNQTVQEKISDLIKHMKKLNKTVDQRNRILIVHNLMKVKDKTTLDNKITTIGKCFQKRKENHLDLIYNEEGEESTDTGDPWDARNLDGVDIYYGVYTAHFFLVDKDAPVDNANNWDPSKHNEKIFNALRQTLLMTNRSTVKLFEEILLVGTEKLGSLLEEFADNNCALNLVTSNKKKVYIMPAVIKQQQEDDRQYRGEYQTGDILKRKIPFKLTSLRFENGLPESKYIIDLDGNITMSKDKKRLFLCIRAAGINETMRRDEFIKFRWDIKNNSLDVNIKIEPPSPPKEIAPDGHQEIITNHVIHRMLGRFKFWFPMEHRPGIPKNSEKFDNIVIKEGEIWLPFEIMEIPQ